MNTTCIEKEGRALQDRAGAENIFKTRMVENAHVMDILPLPPFMSSSWHSICVGTLPHAPYHKLGSKTLMRCGVDSQKLSPSLLK